MAKTNDDKMGLDDKLSKLKDEIIESLNATIKHETNVIREYFDNAMKDFADKTHASMRYLSK